MDFDFNCTKLTGVTKKVCVELNDYVARMIELKRHPVLRVKRADFIAMRAFAQKHIRPGDTLDRIMLDGREVFRYDGE